MLVDLGVTACGVPVSVHRAAVETELLISAVIVEPHQYTGYSGGPKTVAVGAAGEPLITYTHGPAFVDHPATRLGRIEGNPFHGAITEAARCAKLGFILNFVLDDDKRILKVAAGELRLLFRNWSLLHGQCTKFSFHINMTSPSAGQDFPKTLIFIRPAACPRILFCADTDGTARRILYHSGRLPGGSEGWRARAALFGLRDAPNVQTILDDARRNGYPPGQQRAFVVAKVLEKTRIVIVGSECPDVVAACKMIPVATMDEALGLAQ